MMNDDRKVRRVLFLLRSYNDIDHIAPIIWKCREHELSCYFLLVESDHSRDYRIKFIEKCGAIRLHSRIINFYHSQVRRFLPLNYVRKAADGIVSYTLGKHLLAKYKIEVVVTEWSGRSGRGKATYILKPAFQKHLRVYSVPHGYNIYKNLDVSKTVAEFRRKWGRWPDFGSRNVFTRYVVQHEATRTFCEAYGIKTKNLIVLGSTRFCQEWVDINEQICPTTSLDRSSIESLKVVFFLPQWDYNVDREGCYRLILLLSEIPEVFIRLKGSTRKLEGLYHTEQEHFIDIENIVFSNSETSTSLIQWSDVVINFASSIGLEAVMQNKIILNPKYLHTNKTIFDDSGVVIDCDNSDSVQREIEILKIRNNHAVTVDMKHRQEFYERFIQGNAFESNVLGKYVDLVKGEF